MATTDKAVDTTLEDEICGVLGSSSLGLRRDEIRRRLARSGILIDEARLAELLRRLQEAGKLDFKMHRWSLKAAYRSAPRPPDPPRAKPPEPSRGPKPPQPATPQPPLPSTLPSLPCQTIRHKAANKAERPKLASALPKGWRLFRQLLPYWREALRSEERPNIILPLERANIEFCGLTCAGAWWPDEGHAAEICLTAEHIPAELMANLARQGASEQVFLGYPLQLIPGQDDRGAFARPVLTFACDLRLDAGALRLKAPAQAVDINADWLEKQFKDVSTRRELLRWLGIAAAGVDDNNEDADAFGEPVDLPTVTERLLAWLPTATRRALSPSALATSLPSAVTEAELVNVLVLFRAPTTKFRFGDQAEKEPEQLPALPPLKLNEDQYNATRSALNHALTVITGPPGTGKSQVVTAIMASAALNGRTALLASKNYKALDAVQQRIESLLDDERSILVRASLPFGAGKPLDLRKATESLLARGTNSGD